MPMDPATVIALVLTASGMLAAAVYAVARIESSASAAATATADHEKRLDGHEERIRNLEITVARIDAD